jgi:hypothetical protein
MKKIFLLPLFALLVFSGCTSEELTYEDPYADLNPDDFIVSDINLDIDAPTTAIVGETYDVTISVTNEAAKIQTITSIDIGETYVDGIIFEGSTPEYGESWDFADMLGFYSYDYYIDIAPGATETLLFHFTPFMSGDYQGDLDVCINLEDACLFNTIRTVVSE